MRFDLFRDLPQIWPHEIPMVKTSMQLWTSSLQLVKVLPALLVNVKVKVKVTVKIKVK